MKTAGARRDRVAGPYASRRGCGDGELSLAKLAEVTAVNGDHPVSPQTRTYISLRKATPQAMLGDADLCQRIHQTVTAVA